MRNLFLLLLLLNLLLALWEGQPHLLRQHGRVALLTPAAVGELPSWVLRAELDAAAGTPEPPAEPMPTLPLARLQPVTPEQGATEREPLRCYQLSPFVDAAQRDGVLRRLASANFVLLAPLPTLSFDVSWALTLPLPVGATKARLERSLSALGFEHHVGQDQAGATQQIVSGFTSVEAANAAQLRLAQQGFLFRVERRQAPPSVQRITLATASIEAVAERLEALLQNGDGHRLEAVVVACEGELVPVEP